MLLISSILEEFVGMIPTYHLFACGNLCSNSCLRDFMDPLSVYPIFNFFASLNAFIFELVSSKFVLILRFLKHLVWMNTNAFAKKYKHLQYLYQKMKATRMAKVGFWNRVMSKEIQSNMVLLTASSGCFFVWWEGSSGGSPCGICNGTIIRKFEF